MYLACTSLTVCLFVSLYLFLCLSLCLSQTHLKVAVGAGVVERDQPALVLGVHIRPVLQQVLHHAHPEAETFELQSESRVESMSQFGS